VQVVRFHCKQVEKNMNEAWRNTAAGEGYPGISNVYGSRNMLGVMVVSSCDGGYCW